LQVDSRVFKNALGTPSLNSYISPVSGFLRFVGITNAAIWFGAGIFFAAGILPAVFSQDMRNIFHESGDPYYSGSVALVLFLHYFGLQYICGTIAVLHLLAEKFYSGRALPRFGTALVLAMFAFGLWGGLWLQPRMESLRQTMYFGRIQEQKDHARHVFGLWHGVSEAANLLVLGGLLTHLTRVSRQAQPGRHGLFYQIP